MAKRKRAKGPVKKSSKKQKGRKAGSGKRKQAADKEAGIYIGTMYRLLI
jgi:hypothetical protein